MRILGIDPGSRVTGYGIIVKEGNRLIHVDNGAIFTGSERELPIRLQLIYRELTGIIERYRPEVAALENIFFAKNVQSALKLGQARGAAIVAGVNAGLPVYEYSALQVKQAVVGHGKSAKVQVQQMLKVLLNLPEVAQEDASDALAVAVCHAHSHALNALRRYAG